MASETCFGSRSHSLSPSQRAPAHLPAGRGREKQRQTPKDHIIKTTDISRSLSAEKKNNCIMADFDPEAAKRDAKKMTVPQLKDRLSAAAADTSGRKADLVARWVETAHALAVAKETNRITGEQVFTVSAAIGWRALAGYVDWDTKTALTASCSEGRDAGRALRWRVVGAAVRAGHCEPRRARRAPPALGPHAHVPVYRQRRLHGRLHLQVRGHHARRARFRLLTR